jgi:hypothetical protein
VEGGSREDYTRRDESKEGPQKRLNKFEAILSNVIDQCPAHARDLRELLDSGRSFVVRAKGVVNVPAIRAAKPPAREPESAQGRLSAEGRKRISLAAKKRWTEAKRKGINAVTWRPLSKAV